MITDRDQAMADAEWCLRDIRRHGGVVLRVVDGDRWRLHILNGWKVPTELKFRALELQPYVMMILRKMVTK
jgi:hypothetical protein